MYSAPHEFDLNPPQIFSKLRTDTYDRYVWPRVGQVRSTRALVGTALSLAVAVFLLALRLALHPLAPKGSPYGFIPHDALIAVALAPVVWGLSIMTIASLHYWRDIGGSWGELAHPVTWMNALSDGARLKHMSGGGPGCDYPGDSPNNLRKYFHLTLVAGFGLCFASTTVAAIEEEFLNRIPPYPIISAPVLLGLFGGAGMLVGCLGLLRLQQRRNLEATTPRMSAADRVLVWTLIALAGTGVLTTVLRSTSAYAAILLIHLATVVTCFAIAPYTKFAHFVYRSMSIYKDRLEAAPRN